VSEKKKKPLEQLGWFNDLVENLPRGKSESFTDRVIDLESAKLVHAAGEVAMGAVHGPDRSSGVDKGVTEGLEAAGKKIITDKLTGQDPIRAKVDEVIGELVADSLRDRLSGGGKANAAELELARRDRTAELEVMFQKFHQEIVLPLATEVKALAEKGGGGSGPMTTDAAVEMVMGAQEKAKKLLEQQGFSVENVSVTKEDVAKMLNEEKAKTDKLLGEEKEKWEKESGATVEIERERIQATENILTGVVDRVFDIFLEPLKDKIHEAIEKGAFARKRA